MRFLKRVLGGGLLLRNIDIHNVRNITRHRKAKKKGQPSQAGPLRDETRLNMPALRKLRARSHQMFSAAE